MQFCDISHVLHLREPVCRYRHRKGFYLACPYRSDTVHGGGKRETADSIKQAS